MAIRCEDELRATTETEITRFVLPNAIWQTEIEEISSHESPDSDHSGAVHKAAILLGDLNELPSSISLANLKLATPFLRWKTHQ